MNPPPYTPIACGLYDLLEIWAMRKQSLQLQLQGPDQSLQEVTGVLVDLWAENGIEYARLESGLQFRLDELVAIDGEPFSGLENACCINK
jgi:Rho-binding antiterminator